MSVKIEKAKDLAKVKHINQTYRYGSYFDNHLAKVAAIVTAAFEMFGDSYLLRHANKEDYIATAFLHDVLEDTDTTYEELALEFGAIVADAVLTLSRVKGISYFDSYLPSIVANPVAVIVKLADAQCNFEASLAEKNEVKTKKYEKVLNYLQTSCAANAANKGIYQQFWRSYAVAH